MRKFKVNGTSYQIVNNGNIEGNKYDVLAFSTRYNGWVRVTSCKTLAEGKEKAMDHEDRLRECIN